MRQTTASARILGCNWTKQNEWIRELDLSLFLIKEMVKKFIYWHQILIDGGGEIFNKSTFSR